MTTQISAYISEETKTRMERYARARGLKKGFFIESALLHHLQALEELPSDTIIPARLVVSRRSFEKIVQVIEHPEKPTAAMSALFEETK
jgi:uncharacterized protein (DUF1778 family)